MADPFVVDLNPETITDADTLFYLNRHLHDVWKMLTELVDSVESGSGEVTSELASIGEALLGIESTFESSILASHEILSEEISTISSVLPDVAVLTATIESMSLRLDELELTL